MELVFAGIYFLRFGPKSAKTVKLRSCGIVLLYGILGVKIGWVYNRLGFCDSKSFDLRTAEDT